MTPQMLNEMLEDDFSLTIAKELGFEEEEPMVRAALIADLGTNIVRRIALEVLKVLPEEKRDEFDALIGADNIDAMHALVSPYVSDFNAFVIATAKAEIEDTKKAMLAV